jgi:plastocyanin
VNITRYARIVWRAVRRPSTGRWTAAAFLGLASMVSPFTPPPAQAGQQWRVAAGASIANEGVQALGFYPAEITINPTDSVTWSFRTGEDHTVTFGLLPDPPPYPAGYPAANWPNWPGLPGPPVPPFLWAPITTGTAVYPVPGPATGFVNSGMRGHGEPTFTVSFPTAGNFEYVCLLHPSKMTGTVHVQAAGTAYPHDQNYYDRQGQQEQTRLIANARQIAAQARSTAQAGAGQNQVVAGVGDGFVAVDRFLPETVRIGVGQTVVWSSTDQFTPHTVTFGPEPLDPVPPPQFPATLSELAFLRAFGVDSSPPSPAPRHATISTNPVPGTVNSAIFGGTSPRRSFSATFMAPGTYRYTCLLHDEFGMTGTVIVH